MLAKVCSVQTATYLTLFARWRGLDLMFAKSALRRARNRDACVKVMLVWGASRIRFKLPVKTQHRQVTAQGGIKRSYGAMLGRSVEGKEVMQ